MHLSNHSAAPDSRPAGSAAGVAALFLAAGLFVATAAPPPPAPGAPPVRQALRTNRSLALPGVNPRTNLALPQPPGKAGAKAATNAPGATKAKAASGTNAPAGAGLLDDLKRLQTSGLLYPILGGVLVVILAVLVFFQLKEKKTAKAQPAAGPVRPLAAARRGPVPVHICNVLEVDTEARRVWQFDARGNFRLNREHTSLPSESLPASLVAKDWRTLLQRKLNVAWLPPEHVFLRVAHLPKSDFDETSSMVELQMEKLSPMPVTQIVWSFHAMAHPQDNLQTVVVMIVERSLVEEYLGKLEGQGYLADRLEMPLLDQLQATAITEDGAWIYPQGGGVNTGLVAWWYGGVLQTLDLLTLPATNRAAGLREQLTQMAWAGEMEGWLTAPPVWHLVADVAAPDWEPALREGLAQPVDVLTPLPGGQLAALTARRAAQSDARATLMPPEYAARYQQQFFDRLWMRGLGAVVGIYVVGVAIYLGALAVATYRTTAVEERVAALGESYTNTLKLEARFQVLKDREELKYAALDCWGTAARLLPEGFTIDSMRFADGKRLSLSGGAPADQIQQLYAFEASMRKAQVNGQPLFKTEGGETATFRATGQNATWSFSLDLKREETQ